jgi:protein-S-isoprenylcysteine O-methyltransferase Ste14
MDPDFQLERTAGGLILGLVGAAIIGVYPRLNRAARRRGAAAHWARGWIVAVLGMGSMASGWALLASSGPRLVSGVLTVAGALVSLLALATYLASARWVGRWRRPESYSLDLETRGIYARVRHPQALSLCLASLGAGLLTGSIPYLATLPLWIGFWTLYTYIEESSELLPAFGERYRLYRKSVPRLIPRLNAPFLPAPPPAPAPPPGPSQIDSRTR